MKTPVKAEIVTDTLTLKDDGVIHLKLSGDNLFMLTDFVKLRKLGPGSVVMFQLYDRLDKSYEQLKTFFLLLRRYDLFFQGNFEGYTRTMEDLEDDILEKYGAFKEKTKKNGEKYLALKRLSKYKMREMSHLISGLFEEMIRVFAEYNWEDKRFEEMVKEFNSQKIEKVKEVFERF